MDAASKLVYTKMEECEEKVVFWFGSNGPCWAIIIGTDAKQSEWSAITIIADDTLRGAVIHCGHLRALQFNVFQSESISVSQ